MQGAMLYQLPFEKQKILLSPGGDVTRGLEFKFDLAWMRVYVCVPEGQDRGDDCGYRNALPLQGWRELRPQLLVHEPRDSGPQRDEFTCYRSHYGYNWGPSMAGKIVTIKLPPLPNKDHGCSQAHCLAARDARLCCPHAPPPPEPVRRHMRTPRAPGHRGQGLHPIAPTAAAALTAAHVVQPSAAAAQMLRHVRHGEEWCLRGRGHPLTAARHMRVRPRLHRLRPTRGVLPAASAGAALAPAASPPWLHHAPASI